MNFVLPCGCARNPTVHLEETVKFELDLETGWPKNEVELYDSICHYWCPEHGYIGMSGMDSPYQEAKTKVTLWSKMVKVRPVYSEEFLHGHAVIELDEYLDAKYLRVNWIKDGPTRERPTRFQIPRKLIRTNDDWSMSIPGWWLVGSLTENRPVKEFIDTCKVGL